MQVRMVRAHDIADECPTCSTELKYVAGSEVDRSDEPSKDRVPGPRRLSPAVVHRPHVGYGVHRMPGRVVEEASAGPEPQ